MATQKRSTKASVRAPKKAVIAMANAAPNATPADAKEDAIYGCIVKVFHDAGLPHISTLTAKIVWGKLVDPPNLVDQLGNGVRDCIIGHGYQCDGLAGLFRILRDGGKVTTVSETIALIEPQVTP